MELLRTDRLLLRHWDKADLAAFFDLYSREEVARWLGAHPRRPVATLAEAEQRLGRWHEHGRGLSPPLGLWAVVPRAAGTARQGRPVGTILLLPLSDDDGPTGLVEVGWHLHPGHQGQGFATEAARAVLVAAETAGIDQVLAITDLDNAASQRVATRLDMTDEGVTQRWFGLTARQYRKVIRPPESRAVTLPDDVIRALAAETRISGIELTGSRARGQATPLSDWDFAVTTARFDEVRDAMPETVRPLRPVVAQWDRLSRTWCYMMILTGPAKVDLLFGHPHQPAGPWKVNATTLAGVDGHFWDWALWLQAKLTAGKHDTVAVELGKLHEHLLGPMGVGSAPASLREAVAAFLAAREDCERRLRLRVPRGAEDTVMPVLRS